MELGDNKISLKPSRGIAKGCPRVLKLTRTLELPIDRKKVKKRIIRHSNRHLRLPKIRKIRGQFPHSVFYHFYVAPLE